MEVRTSLKSVHSASTSRSMSVLQTSQLGQRCSLTKRPLTAARIYGDLQSCNLHQNRGSANRCVIQPSSASTSQHVGLSTTTASILLRARCTTSPPAGFKVNSTVTTSSRNVSAASAATMSSEAAPSEDVPSRSWGAMVGAMTNTTHDSEIFKLALPALVAMLLDPVMGAISAGMMGHLGTQQLSAISLGILTTSFCTFLFSFLVFLTTPEVAGAVVRKDFAEASRIASKGFWLAGGLGAITALLVFFGSDSIVQVMSPPEPEVEIYAAGYMKVRALGVFAALMQFVATGTFRGFKDTSTPLIAAILSASTSLVLNITFIYGLGWGVYGAGLATTMAQLVSCTFLCSRMLTSGILKVDDLKKPPAWAEVMPMLKVGGILTLRNIISFGTVLYASKLCVSAGSQYQAGFEVIRQVWILTIQFFECLNVAAQSLCATFLGSGDRGNARLVLGRISFLGVSTGAFVGALVYFNQMPITNFFTVDPVVIYQVLMALPMVCLMFPLDAAASIMDGSLLAARQTNFMSYTQMAGAIVQCTMLYALVEYGSISVFSTWACLKLLTFVRIGAGVFRNFITPSESAYFGAPVAGALMPSSTPVLASGMSEAPATESNPSVSHPAALSLSPAHADMATIFKAESLSSVARESLVMRSQASNTSSATALEHARQEAAQQQQQQSRVGTLERMVYTGSMFSSMGSYDTDSYGNSIGNDGGGSDNSQPHSNSSSSTSSSSSSSSDGFSHHSDVSSAQVETQHTAPVHEHAVASLEVKASSVDEAEQGLLGSIHVPALAAGIVEIVTVGSIAISSVDEDTITIISNTTGDSHSSDSAAMSVL